MIDVGNVLDDLRLSLDAQQDKYAAMTVELGPTIEAGDKAHRQLVDQRFVVETIKRAIADLESAVQMEGKF